jgi:hypothetical protein
MASILSLPSLPSLPSMILPILLKHKDILTNRMRIHKLMSIHSLKTPHPFRNSTSKICQPTKCLCLNKDKQISFKTKLVEHNEISTLSS